MAKKKKKPALRFKGCIEDWKECPLGQVLVERNELQKITEDAPILAFASGQGVIDRSERKSNNRDHLTKDQATKIYKLTEFDDIVYNPSNLKYGAIDRNKHGRGVISPIYVTFTTDEEPSFIELIVKSEKFKLRALRFEEGTVVKRQSVKPENLLSLNVVISPSREEQKFLGNLFTHLDGLIAHNQSKYDKLATVKKAMLQKMFPKKGKLVPEIRFKGFSGNWCIDEFVRSFNGISNNSLSRADLNYDEGLVKNVHYGDVLIKFGQLLDLKAEKLPFISDEKLALKYSPSRLQDGDIVIADAAEDFTVGKCSELVNVGNEIVVSGLHTIAVRPTKAFASGYLGYYLNSSSYHDQLLSLMQGTKVLSLSKTALQDTIIMYPRDRSEQVKIGDYFKNLDKVLTLHKQELEKLQHIRKACLQKIIV